MSRIAWRAWVDFCRHRKAETGALGTAVDVDDVELESPPDSTVDPHALALWRFAVCEWFARHSPRCLDPAKFVFDGRSWAEAAECLKERPNSLAKRWQRCREQFLSYVRADRGELRDLLDYFEGLAT
ncbi:MAG: hypothetical protein ACREOU_09405 [Candidatus Eiseniibacteriota bacterium]